MRSRTTSRIGTSRLDRLFLDANVLFSAAHSRDSLLRPLWEFPDVELLTSVYAIEEARRNLARKYPSALANLGDLLVRMSVCGWVDLGTSPPQGIEIVEKDTPVLVAAIRLKATHLLTGDRRHFTHLYGQTVEGVLILKPGQYIHEKLNKG